ncbi:MULTISPECIES: hypothetical protein [Massilia]|uniref:hypothetical protein n=1 Tax=Massilia TaxID=149698 RepID=UPI000F2DE8B7|nr:MULTISPECIES: hypothetical protein [Massilia]MDY0962108.1 hypothetical protein [Massilia sp. CFBP9026]
MYYRPETKQIFSLQTEIRTALPNVLFGPAIAASDLEECGIFPLSSQTPSVDAGKIAVPTQIALVDDRWTQLWSIREMTPEELTTQMPQVPQEITMRQARLALLSTGVLAQVASAIETLPDAQRDAARIEWEFSSTVVRDRPLVKMLGQALGLDDQALDQLFITAAEL